MTPKPRVAIVIPVYNDWEAVSALLPMIDRAFADAAAEVRVFVVDDGSTQTAAIDPRATASLTTIAAVEVLHLICNVGHQRAIAVGLADIARAGVCDYAIVMDSDGEDRPEDAAALLAAALAKPEFSGAFVARRARRSEGFTFKAYYQLYKLLFRLLSGQTIDFGNFSLLPASALNRLVHSPDLWNHFPASVVKSKIPVQRIPTDRGTRLAGRSSMNVVGLVALGLSAMSVYSDVVFVRILIASLGLSLLAALGLIGVVFVKLFSALAIPGWATTAGGILAIILVQALTFSTIAAFLNLSGRSNALTIPARDAAGYVERREYVVGTVAAAVPR
jgi:polyisoprenyl-phosphate glycosyltransferase